MKSYLKQAVAFIKGDTDNVIAEKNYRRLSNAIKGQMSALQAKRDKQEEKLDNAKEALDKLTFPEVVIEDAAYQLEQILRQQVVVEQFADAIADIDHTIDKLNKLQAGFDLEVPEEAPAPASK